MLHRGIFIENISRSLNTTSHLRESNDGVYSSHNFRRGTNLVCTLPFPFGTIFHPFLRRVTPRDFHNGRFRHPLRCEVSSHVRAVPDLARILHPNRFICRFSRLIEIGRLIDRSKKGELITYNRSRTSMQIDGFDFHRARRRRSKEKGKKWRRRRRRR